MMHVCEFAGNLEVATIVTAVEVAVGREGVCEHLYWFGARA